MELIDEFKNKQTKFYELCQTHNVKVLFVFGSSITQNFNTESSDIDLLVEIDERDPIERGTKFMSLWDTFFNRKINLLRHSSIKNPIWRRNINSIKRLIYDGRRKKVHA